MFQLLSTFGMVDLVRRSAIAVIMEVPHTSLFPTSPYILTSWEGQIRDHLNSSALCVEEKLELASQILRRRGALKVVTYYVIVH
jgi:hypothetical protein